MLISQSVVVVYHVTIVAIKTMAYGNRLRSTLCSKVYKNVMQHAYSSHIKIYDLNVNFSYITCTYVLGECVKFG